MVFHLSESCGEQLQEPEPEEGKTTELDCSCHSLRTRTHPRVDNWVHLGYTKASLVHEISSVIKLGRRGSC